MQIRSLNDQDLKNIFKALLLVIEELNIYFLNPSGLLLNPEHVFFRGSNYYFCYDPMYQDTIEMKMSLFAENLLSYIDHDNELAVVLAYQFYKLSKQEGFTALSILHELVGIKTDRYENEQKELIKEPMKAETQTMNEPVLNLESSDPSYQQELSIDINDNELSAKTKVDTSLLIIWRDDKLTIILFLLLMMGSMGYFIYCYLQYGTIQMQRELTNKNGILAIVFFVLGLLGLMGCIMLQQITNKCMDYKKSKKQDSDESIDNVDKFNFYQPEKFEVFKELDGESVGE